MLNRNLLLTTAIALSLSSGAAIAAPLSQNGSDVRATNHILLAERSDNGGNGNGHALMGKLNLTADQKKAMQSIQSSYRPQIESKQTALKQAQDMMQSLMQNGNTSRSQLEAQHNTLSSLRQDLTNLHFRQMMDIRDVLTTAQREQFAQHMQERKGEGSGTGNGNRRGSLNR